MSTERPLKKPVRCPKCRFFLFEIVLTPEASKMQDIGAVESCTCPNRKCRAKITVSIGCQDKQ